MLASWYFDSWSHLWDVAASTAVLFVGLVILLRLGGKRTLARFTIFDWAVSVAFGSTMATAMTSTSVSVADGLVAFAMLVLLQTAVALVVTHVPHGDALVTGTPRLLAYRGSLHRRAMRRERVSEAEVRQALRQQGFRELGEVEAVVLEPTGDLAVLPRGDGGEVAVLDDVAR